MEVQELRSRCEEQSANLSASVSSDMVIWSCNYCWQFSVAVGVNMNSGVVSSKTRSLNTCPLYLSTCLYAFSALTLLVGRQEEHLACKKYGVMRCWRNSHASNAIQPCKWWIKGFFWSRDDGVAMASVQVICTSLQTDNYACTSSLKFVSVIVTLPLLGCKVFHWECLYVCMSVCLSLSVSLSLLKYLKKPHV